MRNYLFKTFSLLILTFIFLFSQSLLVIQPAFSSDQPTPPPPPGPPHLNKPVDPNFDATFLVDWTDVDCVGVYELEEADNLQFSGAINYSIPRTTSQKWFSKETVGTYYYRVKANYSSTQEFPDIGKRADFFQKTFAYLKEVFSLSSVYAYEWTCAELGLNTNWSNVQNITIVEPTSYINGSVFDSDTESSLQDAVITSPDFPGSATSGIDGKFSFSFQTLFPESGKLTLTIDITKENFTSAQRTVEVVASRHSAVDPIYLTALDPVVTTIPPEGGTHTNSTGEIELIFPAGAVTEPVDVNSTKYQKAKALPDELPETTFFTYALNLEAQVSSSSSSPNSGKRVTTFQQPVTMKVANTLGFAPGTPIPDGVYNYQTQQWEDTGLMGYVSADGQWLEYEITHFSPHDCNLPAPPPPEDRNANPTANNTQDAQIQPLEATDPGVGVKSGSLTIEHSLPAIRRLGKQDNLKFVYSSLTAQPSSLIFIETDLDSATTNIPLATTFKVNIADRQVQATYQGVEGEVRYAYLFDAKDSQGNTLPTGSYPYSIEVSNDYTDVTYWTTNQFAGEPIADTGIPTIEPVPLTTTLNNKLTINNQQDPPFGAGWNLSGLQRLYFDPEGTILLTEGDGSSMVFRFRQQSPISDLAIANVYADNDDVSILLGNGDGTFTAQPDVSVGWYASSLTTADFNVDTIPDLAVPIYWNGFKVSILLGNGDGTFSAQPNVPVGEGIYSILTNADFNGDTIPDLAVANVLDYDVSILLGNGDGTFTAQPDVPVGNDPYGITTADFNGDTLFDLAVCNLDDYDVSILLGNGDGTFTAQPDVPVGNRPWAITTADFNGDTLFDLAVCNSADNDVSILLGNGDGTFTAQPDVPVGNRPRRGITTADFNGDTLFDLAVCNSADNDVSILLGNGDGTFLIQPDIPVGNGPSAITTADFNGDTIPDLAVTNYSDNDVSILLGNGDGTFLIQPDILVGNGPIAITTADFNGDYFEEGYVVYYGDYSLILQNPEGTYTRTLKDGTQINFNAQGLQTSVVDHNGNTTTYLYVDANSDGNQEELSQIILPTGEKYLFSYSPQGKLESITDPAGKVTQFIIDENGDLVQITNPDTTNKSFTYNNHLLTSETNGRSHTTSYEYDDYGRVERMLFPNTPQEVIQFFPSDIQGLINDLPEGVGTPDNPAPVVRPEDIVETVIDGKNYTTTSRTSKFGSYSQLTDALNQTTAIERDINNNPIKITRPNSSTVTMTYGGKGNLLTSTEDSISATTTFTYESEFNQITSIIDPEENTTIIDYDENGNPIQITDSLNNITKMEYNSRGLLTKIISAFGSSIENQTTFTYYTDTYNLKTITDPEANTTIFTYDEAGNILTIQDAETNTTTFEYDEMNRLTKVTDPESNITQYQYDESGNLKKIIDANSNETTFTYDEINQLKAITNPLNKTKSFSYDLNRNLQTLTDFKVQTITFTYDEINRLTNKTGPDLNVTFGYDLVNNLTSATTLDSSLTLTYDLASRLETSTTANLGHQPATTISYTYDKNSNRLTLTDPQAIITKYVYDSLNRLTDITDSLDNTITHFDYDGLSRRTGLSLANGTSTSYDYDLASRITSLITTAPAQIKRFRPKNRFLHLLDELIIKNVFAASKTSTDTTSTTNLTDITSYTYTYDNAGNRDTMSDTDGTHNYTYDDIYRLTQATHPQPENPAETFSYDPVGNRNPATYVYDAANRFLDDGEYTYEYDDNGNLISKTDKSTLETTTYTYDTENQLTRIDFPDTTYAEYTYDGLGRRIEKDVNGTITRYVYDNEDIIAEYDGSNTLQAKYLHGPGIDEPIRMERGGQSYWYHVDGLGSITALTDSTGLTTRTYLYDSFGNIKAQTGSLTNPFTYTAREFDEESGLYYYRARYYDSTIGRFLQTDSIIGPFTDPQTLNLYIYVSNSPINWIDPWGLLRERSWWEWWAYESVLPGSFGQPISEWGPYGPTGWGDPMKYTEEAGGGWMWAERGAMGISAVATATAIGAGTGIIPNYSFRMGLHPAHHTFKYLGKSKHIQVTRWLKGLKGSHKIWRIPIPWIK